VHGGSALLSGLKRSYRLILTVVTLSVGLIVLLSFIIDNQALLLLRNVLVEWTVIVVAFALLLGVLNVLRVHGQRIQRGQGTIYSLVLIVSVLAVFIPGILSPGSLPDDIQGFAGPTGSVVGFIYQYVQRPLQATLFSLMAFFVATAAWRAFRLRSAASWVMFVAALFVLLGSIRLAVGSQWSLLTETRNWILSVPAMAGARGILLGIVLGTIVAGARLLLGIDRPYSD
jgi:hypothetical protein